jgi:hypothetical protein
MPTTFDFQEEAPAKVADFDFQEEGTIAKAKGFDFEPEPSPDLSKIKLSPYEQAVEDRGGLKAESGMEAGKELLTAIATEGPTRTREAAGKIAKFVAGGYSPVAQPINKALGYAGNVVRAIPADIAESITGNQKYYDMLNLGAAALGEPMPIDEQLRQASSESKAAAVTGKVSQGVAAMIPMIAAFGGLPAVVQKAALAGFTVEQLAQFQDASSQLGEELGKPQDQQDPDKITSLVSDLTQTGVFSGLGIRGGRKMLAPREVAPPARIGMEAPSLTGAEKIARPGEYSGEQVRVGPLGFEVGRLPLPTGAIPTAPSTAQLPPPAQRDLSPQEQIDALMRQGPAPATAMPVPAPSTAPSPVEFPRTAPAPSAAEMPVDVSRTAPSPSTGLTPEGQGRPFVTDLRETPEGPIKPRAGAPYEPAPSAPEEVAKANPHDFVPALKPKEGEIIPGKKGQVHDDIYNDQGGIEGLELKVSQPEHGFLYKGEFKTRREAADLLGQKDDLHSETLLELQKAEPQVLPERDPTLHLDYSPEDLARYLELKPKTIPKTAEEFSSSAFQATWKEFEALKNKYNGNPPKQIVEGAKPTAPVVEATPEELQAELNKELGQEPAKPTTPVEPPPAAPEAMSSLPFFDQLTSTGMAETRPLGEAAMLAWERAIASGRNGELPIEYWVRGITDAQATFDPQGRSATIHVAGYTEDLKTAHETVTVTVLDDGTIRMMATSGKEPRLLKAAIEVTQNLLRGKEKPVPEVPQLPAAPVETKAEAKVETPGVDPNVKAQAAVNRVVTTEGVTSGKEAKATWIDELNKAIGEARSEADLPGLKAERAEMEKPRYIPNEALWAKAKEEIGTVTINIPGDGETHILNTKEALQAVLDRAKKISTSSGEPVKVKKRGTSEEDRAWIQEQLAKGGEPTPAAPEGKGLAGEVPLGFGGGVRPPKPPVLPAADPTPEPTPVTPEQAAAVQTTKTPGLLSGIAMGIKSLLLPSTKGQPQLKAAELLGSKLGAMHRRGEATATSLRPFSRMFDKLGVHREGLEPADNPGVKFMSDMSQGRPMSGWQKTAGDMVERMFAARLQLLVEAGAELQTVRENYFPGMWTRESRLAFNAVMEKMGKDFDPAKATSEQKAAIRAEVNKLIDEGVGSERDAMSFLTRKPLAGRESFRKQKVFDDIMDGAELGLRPISNNPMDLVQLKLAEMDKSVMAHEYFQALKERSELETINPYEEIPAGWVRLNDKYGTIYGPPTVSVPEYIDAKVYDGLLKVAKDLGIKHERLMRFPPGQGSQALGLSYQGQNRIMSRFGTETSVIAHEIGHQLDVKYGLWDLLTGGERGSERKSVAQKELRAIADETERGGKARKKEEKMAQVMEAYIHAPERMKEIAPTIFAKFDSFVKGTPELKEFANIKPGLALKELAGEKYVGLPILGYRIVPEAHADIANNYLSSSLYNNRYFGSLYKGWMSTANALNQSQLGMGSAFHAGFTTGEAQISSGANVLKDIYGVLRGNRSVADLGKSVVKTAVGTIRNPVIGDRVLNAWRNPEGQINPRIAQVVRAAELAGGGFKLESGLRTEQSIKALRDWYSGHRLRAAARSPIALVELLAKPTMDLLVPRQKAGVFADLAWRIIEQNPGKSLEELTPQFRQAWNRVDARLGQVRYDRLFINNTAKNVVQGLVRAPGWSGGTIAEIGGGFTDAGKFLSDWVKTGKLPENLPDRTAYTLSLVTTVGAINAALTYAFTGTQPHGLDFFAFRTGNKDEQGRDERFLIPSYVKDMIAYARHPGETLTGKMHPLIQMLSDVARNKDHFGVEVRSPDASIPKQVGQTAAYVAKNFEPFWTRGTRREVERGAKPISPRTVAPFFGVMPAPRSVTQTPAENLAHDLMLEQLPVGARSQAQAERAKQKAAAAPKGDYLLRVVKRLSPMAAVRVYEKANADERKRIRMDVAGKIDRSETLSAAEKSELRKRVLAK